MGAWVNWDYFRGVTISLLTDRRKSWYKMRQMNGKVVTGGKPYQSRLAPYEAEIDRLRLDGASIRGIAAGMFSRTSPSSRQGIRFADSLRLGDMRRRGAEVF